MKPKHVTETIIIDSILMLCCDRIKRFMNID